jgi:hypothetical protein
MTGGGSRVALALTALAVLVFVGVVAVASTGSTPGGTADSRAPADVLLDTFFSLALLSLIPAAALLVYGLLQRKDIARELASGRYRRAGIGAYLVFAILFSLAAYGRLRNWSFLPGGQTEDVVDMGESRPVGAPETGPPSGRVYEAEFAWIPVAIILGLAAVGIAAYVVASRRRRPAPAEEEVAERLADVVEETLDDLRAEKDARRAVVAAYARLERALAASGLPRRRQETAEEYVARILGSLEVDRGAVRRLTDLYEWAKFSQHDVEEAMKLDAIAALEQIRDELRAAASRAEEPELAPQGQAAAS